MKPVVSSLVALAIAIAPLSAFAAKPAHPKTHHSKVAKNHKADKADTSDNDEKTDAEEASPIVKVKAPKKGGHGAMKPIVHHAHNVDLGGSGHTETKVDRGRHH